MSSRTEERGSPPRMRGKLQLLGFYKFAHRITPAHAGKTMSTPYVLRGARDHPRACGENLGSIQARPLSLGSPPRMRGKLHPRLTVSEPTGITPAHAGKTSRLHTSLPTRRDHPRACGENAIMSAVCVQSTGSSPRVRGKLQPVPCSELRVGITPACAGKTCAVSSARLPMWNHPRVCGENRCELRYATD